VGATILSLFIIYDWAGTCLENVIRLTGEAANDRTERKLTFMAYRFESLVEGFKSIKAYHAGDGVCVEIDVLMREDAPLRKCHDNVLQILRRVLPDMQMEAPDRLI
jgi:divalent metal cation (Fe/Co/Zn/Cd) transporter